MRLGRVLLLVRAGLCPGMVPAMAQDYPARPIRLMPLVHGAAVDIVAPLGRTSRVGIARARELKRRRA